MLDNLSFNPFSFWLLWIPVHCSINRYIKGSFADISEDNFRFRLIQRKKNYHELSMHKLDELGEERDQGNLISAVSNNDLFFVTSVYL